MRRKLIKAYNDRLISKHAKNPRMLWRSIKEVCYVRNVCEQKVDAVRVDGKLVVNEQDIANAMNDYFIKIGPTTQQQARNVGLNLPSVNYTLRGELYEPAEKTLFSTFELVEKKDLVPIVNSLKNNAVSEFDIPAKALKIILEADPVPVVAFVNSILQCGVIPKSLKRSVVTPHFKKGDPLELINYRPISKTSNLLKIPEKIIKTQIMDYLNAKNLLYEQQYGFRSGRNVMDACYELVAFTQRALDHGRLAAGLFIDITKAFDCVDKDLFLKKTKNQWSYWSSFKFV